MNGSLQPRSDGAQAPLAAQAPEASAPAPQSPTGVGRGVVIGVVLGALALGAVLAAFLARGS
jgi:hypothetical protein